MESGPKEQKEQEASWRECLLGRFFPRKAKIYALENIFPITRKIRTCESFFLGINGAAVWLLSGMINQENTPTSPQDCFRRKSLITFRNLSV